MLHLVNLTHKDDNGQELARAYMGAYTCLTVDGVEVWSAPKVRAHPERAGLKFHEMSGPCDIYLNPEGVEGRCHPYYFPATYEVAP